MDIETRGPGYTVGAITAGEYLRYTVDVTKDGTRRSTTSIFSLQSPHVENGCVRTRYTFYAC